MKHTRAGQCSRAVLSNQVVVATCTCFIKIKMEQKKSSSASPATFQVLTATRGSQLLREDRWFPVRSPDRPGQQQQRPLGGHSSPFSITTALLTSPHDDPRGNAGLPGSPVGRERMHPRTITESLNTPMRTASHFTHFTDEQTSLATLKWLSSTSHLLGWNSAGTQNSPSLAQALVEVTRRVKVRASPALPASLFP